MTPLQIKTIRECYNTALSQLIDTFDKKTVTAIFEFFADESITPQNAHNEQFRLILEKSQSSLSCNILTNLRSMQLETPLSIEFNYMDPRFTFNVIIGAGSPLNLNSVGPPIQDGDVRVELNELASTTLETIDALFHKTPRPPERTNPMLRRNTYPTDPGALDVRASLFTLNDELGILNTLAGDNRADCSTHLLECDDQTATIISGITTRGSAKQRQWLVAHRQAFADIFQLLNDKRKQWRIPRTEEPRMQAMRKALEKQFSSVDKVFNNSRLFSSQRQMYGFIYGGRTAATSTTVTGISALSFLNPPIGVIVTPTVAGCGLFATGCATLYGRFVGHKRAMEMAENTLRLNYNNPFQP